MKRALRILIRVVALPVVITLQILMIIVGLGFVFSEWLFENANRHYSHLDCFRDTIKDYKNYWKGFLK